MLKIKSGKDLKRKYEIFKCVICGETYAMKKEAYLGEYETVEFTVKSLCYSTDCKCQKCCSSLERIYPSTEEYRNMMEIPIQNSKPHIGSFKLSDIFDLEEPETIEVF